MTGICVGCGLCCDGTMYLAVHLRPGDRRESLTAAGFVLTTRNDVVQFPQPCCASRAGACRIYDGRPAACRTYRCRLLRRYEAGEVTHDDASALIVLATDLRDRVRAGISAYADTREPLSLGGLYRVMLKKLEAESNRAAARRAHAELLFDVVSLRVILARDFEPQDSQSFQYDGLPAGAP